MRDETLQRALKRYDLSPHLVFWETTKACSLACRHCRASAQTEALPGELSTDEGRDLIDQIAAMEGAIPILVFTGGDCFERADLESLVGYARSRGVRVGIAPSVTKLFVWYRILHRDHEDLHHQPHTKSDDDIRTDGARIEVRCWPHVGVACRDHENGGQ